MKNRITGHMPPDTLESSSEYGKIKGEGPCVKTGLEMNQFDEWIGLTPDGQLQTNILTAERLDWFVKGIETGQVFVPPEVKANLLRQIKERADLFRKHLPTKQIDNYDGQNVAVGGGWSGDPQCMEKECAAATLADKNYLGCRISDATGERQFLTNITDPNELDWLANGLQSGEISIAMPNSDDAENSEHRQASVDFCRNRAAELRDNS